MDENPQNTPGPEAAPEVLQPQPPAPIESGQAEGPSPRKWLIIGGTVLVLILAAGVGVLGYQNFKSGQQTQTPPPAGGSELPPAPPPVPGEPTTDETANWKTYANTKYSYQFKYPTNWSVGGNEEAVLLWNKPESGEGLDYHITMYPVSSIKNSVNITDPVGTQMEVGDKIFEEKISDIVVDGHPAAKFKVDVLPGSQTDAIPAILVKVKSNSGFIYLKLISFDAVDTQVFDQILSTFQFTN